MWLFQIIWDWWLFLLWLFTTITKISRNLYLRDLIVGVTRRPPQEGRDDDTWSPVVTEQTRFKHRQCAIKWGSRSKFSSCNRTDEIQTAHFNVPSMRIEIKDKRKGLRIKSNIEQHILGNFTTGSKCSVEKLPQWTNFSFFLSLSSPSGQLSSVKTANCEKMPEL